MSEWYYKNKSKTIGAGWLQRRWEHGSNGSKNVRITLYITFFHSKKRPAGRIYHMMRIWPQKTHTILSYTQTVMTQSVAVFMSGQDVEIGSHCRISSRSRLQKNDSADTRVRIKTRKTSYSLKANLSDPRSLKTRVSSKISWTISLFLRLLPCIPCLWKARTESARHTIHKTRNKTRDQRTETEFRTWKTYRSSLWRNQTPAQQPVYD